MQAPMFLIKKKDVEIHVYSRDAFDHAADRLQLASSSDTEKIWNEVDTLARIVEFAPTVSAPDKPAVPAEPVTDAQTAGTEFVGAASERKSDLESFARYIKHGKGQETVVGRAIAVLSRYKYPLSLHKLTTVLFVKPDEPRFTRGFQSQLTKMANKFSLWASDIAQRNYDKGGNEYQDEIRLDPNFRTVYDRV